MPIRKTPLVNDYYYHVFNRGVGKIPIFKHTNDYQRLLTVLNYYRFQNTPLPFSKFIRSKQLDKINLLTQLEKGNKTLVNIIAFCFMPNHFHFILKQNQEKGIITFLGKFQNSYAKYFNTKYGRPGTLFQNSFKAVLLEDDYQLLHLSRYLHLNPYSSMVVKEKSGLLTYPWFSLPQYLGKTKGFCKPEIVLDQFSSTDKYKEFVFDQADYQKNLERIKHLIEE